MSTRRDVPTIQFFGGAGTVTGSKHLITAGRSQVLLDCGQFQGPRDLRRRNWNPPPFEPGKIDAVALSHAHIDHSGYLPVLVRRGFRGRIYCTPGTRDLLKVLLLDAAHLQVEEAAYANRHGFSKHRPAEPLFDVPDVEKTLGRVRAVPYGRTFKAAEGVEALFRRAGHILGSATVELRCGEPEKTIVFTGDLGRRDPEPVRSADYLVVESTYGGRVHKSDPAAELARIVRHVVEQKGVLLVPAFAVGRTQALIWMLRDLEERGEIPRVPVAIDSPMANRVSDIYCRHDGDLDDEMLEAMDAKRCPLCCRQYELCNTPDESKSLNHRDGPLVIIAGSGMATGGRIVHHLKLRLKDPTTSVLLVGYQSSGTRGAALQDGAQTIRIHGQQVPVKASVEVLHGLSSHADEHEMLSWLRGFEAAPRKTFIVHGSPKS